MKFGLIGEKLAHSYSALVHKEFGYDYFIKEVAKANLADFVDSEEYDAFNVTIPYKQMIIPYLDELSLDAEKLNSVNTVIKKQGRLIGHNTDYRGMNYMLEKASIDLSGKKVLILGSGGTSNTASILAKDKKAREVIIVGRNRKVNYQNYYQLHQDAEIVINATPVGMYPSNGLSPINLELLPNIIGVVEVIYNPLKTALQLQAEKLNINYSEGLLMLIAQAKYARDLFLNDIADDSIIEQTYKKLKFNISNIVLIGMPSSGKTVKGKMLAKNLGRSFVDTDELIEKKTGKSIDQIFAEIKEEGFRTIESEVIANVGKKSGMVISTGGGAILKKENRDAIKQNGIIVYVKRELQNLSTSNRPLSKNLEAIELLFNQRKPIYEELADITVDKENIEECVNEIKEKINEYFSN